MIDITERVESKRVYTSSSGIDTTEASSAGELSKGSNHRAKTRTFEKQGNVLFLLGEKSEGNDSIPMIRLPALSCLAASRSRTVSFGLEKGSWQCFGYNNNNNNNIFLFAD
jgi:hypothetical protein